MRDECQDWAVPFALDDLEAAFAWASDHGLPLTMTDEHEHAPEVLEVPPRDGIGSGEVQFSVYRPSDMAGYMVLEDCRTAHFDDLMAALWFCLAQRGADWPAGLETPPGYC